MPSRRGCGRRPHGDRLSLSRGARRHPEWSVSGFLGETPMGRSGLFVAMLSFPRIVLSLKQSTKPTQVQLSRGMGYETGAELKCEVGLKRGSLITRSGPRRTLLLARWGEKGHVKDRGCH